MKAISVLFFMLVGCSSYREKPDNIQGALKSMSRQTRVCYIESDTYMLHKKPLSINASYVIMPDGSTKNHKILSQDPKDPNFTACFYQKLKTLHYKIPIRGIKEGETKILDIKPEGMEIRQPFNFKV